MTSAAILSLAISAQPYGLDDRIKQVPLDNGYRDYMVAARAYSLDKQTRELFRWLDLKEPRSVERPRWVPPSASDETLYSMLRSCFESTWKVIQTGNSKPVQCPKIGLSPATLFSELSYLREMVRLNLKVAHSEALEGDSLSATKRVLGTMTLARNLTSSEGPTIVVLVGQALQSICLDLAWDLPMYSANELSQFESQVSGFDQTPNPLVAALRLDVSTYPELLRLVKECDKDVWSLNKDFLKPPTAQLRAEFDRISAERTTVIYNERLRPFFEDGPLSLAEHLERPEAEWLKPFKVTNFHKFDATVTISADESVLLFSSFRPFGNLVEWLDEDLARNLVTQTRIRLRTRMFSKAIEVAEFRLQHGRLPKDSTEVWGKRPNDPITRYPYQFRPHPDGTHFQVRSWFDGRFVAIGMPPDFKVNPARVPPLQPGRSSR